jgi:hypothetical protein
MAYSTFKPIVTDGLVLNLDAANRRSFVSGSTVWYDLSGRGNTGTLNGGAGFNSANGGSITFDGIDEYVSLPTLPVLTSFTVEMWFNCSGSGTTGPSDPTYNTLIGNSSVNRLLYGNATKKLLAQMGAGNHLSTGSIQLNTWASVHYVYNSSNTTAQWFINGIADSILVGSIVFNTTKTIGSYNLSFYMMKGNISITKLYNRALSSTEILQNYNALKNRYI